MSNKKDLEGRDRILMLREMKEDAQSTLGHQIHASQEMDSKSGHLLRFGVLAMVGGIGLVTLVLQTAPNMVDVTVVTSLAVGAFLNLMALQLLLMSYLDIRSGSMLEVGPSPTWLREKSQDPQWDWEHQLLSILNAAPKYEMRNSKRLRASARRTFFGVTALFATMILYASTMFYILLAGMSS